MKVKNKTVNEVLDAIIDNATIRNALYQRLENAANKNTKTCIVIREALAIYEKHYSSIDKVRSPNHKMKNLSVEELATLISTDDTALSSLRQRLTPSRAKLTPPEIIEHYTAALKCRDEIVKNQRKERKKQKLINELKQLIGETEEQIQEIINEK